MQTREELVVERTALEGRVARRVARVAEVLKAHGGDLDLESVSNDGTVTVRFTKMCAGCPFKPVTMAGTVEPSLLALEGVNAVEAAGARISAESSARLQHYFGYGSPAILEALEADGYVDDEDAPTAIETDK